MAIPVIDSTPRELTPPRSTQPLVNPNTRQVHFACEPEGVSQSGNQPLGSSEFVSQNAADEAIQQLMEAVTRLDWANLRLKDVETLRDMKKNIRLYTLIPLGLAAGHRHPLAILPDKCIGP